jgi:3-oxoacyl-[acyl-carrier-protein] synthase-1
MIVAATSQAPLMILGAGAQSSVGATLPVMSAAVHAGLSRIVGHPDVPEPPPTATKIARAEYFPHDRHEASRLRGFLWFAVAEAMQSLAQTQAREVDLVAYLALPEARPPFDDDDWQNVQRALRQALDPWVAARVHVLRGEGADAVTLLRAARAHVMTEPRRALALVAAVDSQVNDDALDRLWQQRRLARDDRPFGLTPGEGAACLVLAHETWAGKVAPLARVQGVGSGGAAEGPGVALARAVREALAEAPNEPPVATVYSDLNGERERADSWSFGSPRLSAHLRADLELVTPASSHGDLGAANVLALVALATDDLACGRRLDRVLVAAHGEGGEGAAILVGPAARRGRTRAVFMTRELAAHDKAVVAEIADDLMFLIEQRGNRLADEESAPLPDWTSRQGLDERIERLVAALAGCRTLGIDAARTAIAGGQPAGIYLGARVMLAGPDGVEELVRFGSEGEKPESVAALVEAMRHTPGLDRGGTAKFLLEQPPWKQVGLTLAASVDDVAESGHQEDRLHDADPAVAEAAALTFLKVNHAAARAWVLGRAEASPALLGLTGDVRAVDRLASQAARLASDPAFYVALGVLGDPRCIPLVLRGLQDESVAGHAAGALGLLTGAHLVENVEQITVAPDDDLFADELAQRKAGDHEVGVTRRLVPHLCRNQADWQAWLAGHGQRLSPGRRARLGQPFSLATTLDALELSWMPPAFRRMLAAELRCVLGVRTLVEPDAPIQQQRRQIERVRHELAASRRPGR